MTQYCSQYIRPPTFDSDSSDEAPDPFAYVPLSQTQTRKSKKRKTSSMSSSYARSRAKKVKEEKKKSQKTAIKVDKKSPVAGPSRIFDDDDASSLSESILKVEAKKKPSNGSFLRVWDDVEGLNDAQEIPEGSPGDKEEAERLQAETNHVNGSPKAGPSDKEADESEGLQAETNHFQESPKASPGDKKAAESEILETETNQDQESPKAGPSGHRKTKRGQSSKDPLSSSKELASRVPMEGQDGVKSPIKLTLCQRQKDPVTKKTKVLLSIEVEPDMVLKGVDLEVPCSSQDSSADVKWYARATSEEDTKKKWEALFNKAKAGEKQQDMAEKYKQYRVGNTRLIQPPLDKGR